MACANALCEAYGVDRRVAICNFGEKLGAKIIAGFDYFSDQSLQVSYFFIQFYINFLTGSSYFRKK